SLTFKFGRFIEVDEGTKLFNKCDVARVKVVTKEKAPVDSVMEVKVQGKRFDIRVMEEIGGWTENGSFCGKRCPGWQGVQSSRASDDGVSILAAEEGFSETGIDPDVSESC
ncbi:hypothetical protein A2U01_0045294, partial [Trifolium medium]|nr:hypothetical protein [Trifolium medium]